ncbi:MAG: response regulator [Candidatus Marinimicrobia bacterium]|nr:response regulator [Candidatus Neomarinimicrobiota bacterium]MCF7880525.1 response regulator [Candidatus Neomarinimicrobiota bacterium]
MPNGTNSENHPTQENNTILFVDDEPIIRKIVRSLLKKQPYTVLLAESGEEGLKILKDKSVVLVISDYKMEGMDGIEFLSLVEKKYPDIIRMMVTGFANVNVMTDAINQGRIFKILQKPWDRNEFLDAVHGAFELSRSQNEQKNMERKYISHAREMEQRVRERTKELSLVINELQKRNEKLAATHQQLLQSDKMASLGLMAGTLAHDISNPLFVIQGNVEILSIRDYIQPADREILQKIKEQIRRIESLVQSIRNYSKKSAGNFEKLNLIDALEESFVLTRKMINVKNIEVVTHYPENIPYIYGNQNQIEQVFMNIIQNGVQAMEDDGTLTCEIEHVSFNGEDGPIPSWQVTITDTGSGIPQEKLDEIFDAFYTTKDEGTGLGLNICYRIVEEHNGHIDVFSTIDKGTSFVMNYPEHGATNGE